MTAVTQSILESRLPPALAWTEEDLAGSVTDRLLKVAAANPEATALVGLDGTHLTFAELRRAALTLAEEVVMRVGDGPGRVATYVDRSPGAVVAIFGILAAGKAYVPIDPAEATVRSSAKLEHSGAELLVTPSSLVSTARELVGEGRIVERNLSGTTASLTAPGRTGPDDLLNLVYTSGSTGLPKGVIQTHRNVMFETATGARDMDTLPTDRFGLVMPLTMGGSVSDLLGSLLNGAALHIFDFRSLGAAALSRWISDESINATHMAPTVFRRWMAELDPGVRYPEARAIKLGGEPVYHTDVAAFNRHFSQDCVLRNGLGTTETYLITSMYVRPGDTVARGILPVGYAVTGKSVAILDDEGQPVPDGEIGNVTVISDYLSPGYWHDEETTRLKYGVDSSTGTRTYQPGDLGRIRPEDGMLEHLGRSDDMVKINGQRVEVGEVEAVILDLGTVSEVAVMAQPSGDGTQRLVGYIVPAGGGVDQVELRSSLAERMPLHMVPSVFIELESLPVLSFGKVDRKALPLPDGQRPELGIDYRAPSTDEERVIADHAAEILRFDRVGVDDDLFALGMDSLLATRLVASTSRSLGVNLTVDVVLDNPTVAALAAEAATSNSAGDVMDLASLVAELEATDEFSPHI